MGTDGNTVVLLVDEWMDRDGWEHGWTAEQIWDARKHDDAAGGKSGAGWIRLWWTELLGGRVYFWWR